MIIYIINQNCTDMVLRFFQRWEQVERKKKFISKAGIIMILRKEKNSQPTIKPNFISGALIPYLHGHVKYFLNRDSGNSFFRPVHSVEKEFVDYRPKILILYWRGKNFIIYV